MIGTAYMTKKIFFALGTVCTMTVYDGNVQQALRRAKARVMQIHDRMNAYDENSEVSRISQNAGIRPVAVSDDTLRLVAASLHYAQLTGGLFDVTTRPLSDLWKAAIAAKALPLPYEIDRAKALTGSRDIVIDPQQGTVMLKRPGQQLDLGAIAKGYAADEVRRILEQEGVTEAVINLGGTVVNIGSRRRIGIQHPFKKTGVSFARVDAADKAIVTSGLYEQGFRMGGKHYHHIIDPATGYPSQSGLASVTLIGDSAEQLDALSTAAMMMGVRRAVPLLQGLGIEAIFVTVDGEVYTTDGLNRFYANAG